MINKVLPVTKGRILDVGSGNGLLLKELSLVCANIEYTGLDIDCKYDETGRILLYDGNTIPFADNSFDVVMLVDVLHHAFSPSLLLTEAKRVSKKWILIKDHQANSSYDKIMLKFMDKVGNNKTDVNLQCRYFSEKEWEKCFLKNGLQIEIQQSNLNLYPGIINMFLGKTLNCIYLLKKTNEKL